MSPHSSIVLVSPTPVFGGGERMLADAARLLVEEGWRVAAVCVGDGQLADELRDGAVDVTVIRDGRLSDPIHLMRTARAIRALLRLTTADWLLCNHPKGFLYGRAASIGTSVRRAWWQHNEPAARDRVDRLAGKLPCDVVLVVSDRIAAAQQTVTPRHRLAVVPPVVTVPAEPSRAHTGPPVVLAVGRMQPWKGHHYFVQLAATVRAQHPDAVFRIAGGASSVDEVRYRDSLGTSVELLGNLANMDLVYATADIFVSLADGEPFGLTVLEAMARGLPVVAIDAGGPAETVRNGETGVLIPPGDLAAAVEAVSALIADPVLRALLGKAGRHHVAMTYTRDAFRDCLLSALS